MFGRSKRAGLDKLSANDCSLLFAIADLEQIAESHVDGLRRDDVSIWMSHDVAAELDTKNAKTLGLPPVVDLIFKTDVEGLIGQKQFRLTHEWLRLSEKQVVTRIGCILKTSDGPRRLPKWLLDAIKVSENFESGSDLHSHWEALARFRRALEPSFDQDDASASVKNGMSKFLKELSVQIADGFSITPTGSDIDPEFEVVPFFRKTLEEKNQEAEDGEVSVIMAELVGTPLKKFQKFVREKGALSAYKVAKSHYLVIDRSAVPALKVMAEMHHASREERAAFIKNPRQKITAAIEQDLRSRGELNDLSDAQQEEVIEKVAGPIFIETKEYSERVTGKIIYTGASMIITEGSGTTWFPEVFGESGARFIKGLTIEELEVIREKIQCAMSEGYESIEYNGEYIAASSTTERAICHQIQTLFEEQEGKPDTAGIEAELVPESEVESKGPIILEVKENLEQLQWRAKIEPRKALIPVSLPESVKTPLKEYQLEGFKWQVKAWESGLPGILNADEQGLGKTLQTISFISWLKAHMAQKDAKQNGPILIVAPTSLLKNWEQEIKNHLTSGGLGESVSLYGNGISSRRIHGADGKDTRDGQEHLDLSFLHKAIASGVGHNYWLLTSYATLTNYQHSLGRVRFSALVFDEIQALKNPITLRARAGKAINADFRIGLTGTPIENSTTDIWAILDQLVPGRLKPLNKFREFYGKPEEGCLAELSKFIFETNQGLPPMALRRIKDEVAKDLPLKTRILHPRMMSNVQAEVYSRVKSELPTGAKDSILKILHHIRTISVHPDITNVGDEEEFINLSGRLKACFKIIDDIHTRKERVLVFIEHINMQYRFIELLKQRYKLGQIGLINGDTSIPKRQTIVERFQSHLEYDQGFDILVLGPKAAGTGLTLTAATHVIHLSRWWNPAVEEQCNDRVHRIGQKKEVTIHVPMAIHGELRENSFDCLLHSLMTKKRKLASSILWPMGDTKADPEQLQKMLVGEVRSDDTGDPVHSAIQRTFERDGLSMPEQLAEGSYRYD
ncbi:MAG: DEAD/DEAH box helicase [Rhodobacteraceae bacterium]|nr:DEAD/DEAH box helicase [Paracoccaceae bacterium]